MTISSARAEREARYAEEKRKRESEGKNPLFDAAIAGGLAYLTGGVGNALLGAVAPAVAGAVSAIPGGQAIADTVGAGLKLAQPLADSANKVRSLVPPAANYGLDAVSLGSKIAGVPLSLPNATTGTPEGNPVKVRSLVPPAAKSSLDTVSLGSKIAGVPLSLPNATTGTPEGNPVMEAIRGGAQNVGSALAPNEENVWNAIKGGIKGYGAGNTEDAIKGGMEQGMSNLDTLMAQRKAAKTRATSESALKAQGYLPKGAKIDATGLIGDQTFENPNAAKKRLTNQQYTSAAIKGKFSATKTGKPGEIEVENPSGLVEYYTPNQKGAFEYTDKGNDLYQKLKVAQGQGQNSLAKALRTIDVSGMDKEEVTRIIANLGIRTPAVSKASAIQEQIALPK